MYTAQATIFILLPLLNNPWKTASSFYYPTQDNTQKDWKMQNYFQVSIAKIQNVVNRRHTSTSTTIMYPGAIRYDHTLNVILLVGSHFFLRWFIWILLEVQMTKCNSTRLYLGWIKIWSTALSRFSVWDTKLILFVLCLC